MLFFLVQLGFAKRQSKELIILNMLYLSIVSMPFNIALAS